MLFTDFLMVAALVAFLVVWFCWQWSGRRLCLWLSGAIALVAGLASASNYRIHAAVGVIVAALLLVCLLVGFVRNRNSRSKFPWFSGLVVALLVTAAIATILMFPIRDFPAPSGDYAVGTRTFEVVDESRRGLLTAADDEPRRLLVHTWYPAAPSADDEPKSYINDREADLMMIDIGEMVGFPPLLQYFRHIKTNSYVDAPLVEDASDLPVVVYSHGFGSYAAQNTALMEELASHGYVVYSVQHSYTSAATIFPNGDVILRAAEYEAASEAVDPDTGLPESWSEKVVDAFVGSTLDQRYEGFEAMRAITEGTTGRINAAAAVWEQDRVFLLDVLEAQVVSADVVEVVRASDFSRTGEIGMSFGGSTTGGICMTDRRCAAGVNLDGGDYSESAWLSNVPVPFLMLYSDPSSIIEMLGADPDIPKRGFNDFSYERPELAGLRDDVYRMMINESTHFAYSDFSLFLRGPVRTLLAGGVDGPTMIQMQNDLVLDFFDRYLRDENIDFPGEYYETYKGTLEPMPIDDVRTWWLASHPEDKTVRIVMETELGEIEVALYPERAPQAVAQFLSYVDEGYYDGASFYHAARAGAGDGVGIVQGGVMAKILEGVADGEELEERSRDFESPLPNIRHATTHETGIENRRGTIAFDHVGPGTANSEFFINVADNEVFDATDKEPGYVAFGRIIRGLKVAESMQALPRSGIAGRYGVEYQLLERPVVIRQIYRVKE